MTHKLTVRFGGASGATVHDYSGQIRLWNSDGSKAISGGMRCNDGTSSQGTFTLIDVDNEIPRADGTLRLSAHNEVTWSEDSPGYAAWLSVGRITPKDIGRTFVPGTAAVERSYSATYDDGNAELRGITLVAAWTRAAESDVARVQAALTAFCDGSYRDSTVIAQHKIAVTPTVSMPARSYPAGTELTEIFDDCKELAGKTYAEVIHHDAGASHKCFLYIDEEDHSTYLSTLKISDQIDEVDGATVFEPHWRQGSATSEDGQELITGIVSRYGADTAQTVVVLDGPHADAYDKWVAPYNDDLSLTAPEATARATAILHSRWNEHVSHQPSLLIPATLHDLITAGMSIRIRSAAAMGGQYLGTEQTRRIANLEWEPAGTGNDGDYLWANLQLDRPLRMLAATRGKAQPAATTPEPPSAVAASCSLSNAQMTAIATPNGNFEAGTTTNWTGAVIAGSGGGGTGAAGTDYFSYNIGVGAGGWLYDGWSALTFVAGQTYVIRVWVRGTGDQRLNFGLFVDDATLTDAVQFRSSNGDFTPGGSIWGQVCMEWTPSANRTGVRFSHSRGGSATLATDELVCFTGTVATIPPAPTDGTGSVGTTTTGCYATCDHKHPAQTATVTPFTPAGSIAATNVQTGLAEVATEYAAADAAHAAAADPHTGYQKESEKGAANGYASLGAGVLVPMAQLATGTPDGTKFVRDDGTLVTPAGGGMTNPMTTAADLIVGGTAGAPARLAKGADSQVLTVDPTTHLLVWANSASGFTNPMTTKGDVIVGDTGGAAIRKAVGTNGQVLTADSASTGGTKWAAGGGTSGVTWLDASDQPDKTPGSPNTEDDEFNAGSLDAKWTNVNSHTLTFVDSALTANPNSNSAEFREAYVPGASVAFTLKTRFVGCTFQDNIDYVELMAYDSSNAVIANAGVRRLTSGYVVHRDNPAGVGEVAVDQLGWGQQFYVVLSRDASNVWTGGFSLDGRVYSTFGMSWGTSSTTIAKIGFRMGCTTGTWKHFGIDWFRRT